MHLENLKTPEEIQEEKEITEMKRQITNKKYILNNRLSPDVVKKILSLTGENTENANTEGAPAEYLTEEQRKMKKIQLCATTVVLTSIFIVMLYQIASGHQYFVARRYLIEIEEMRETLRFDKDNKVNAQKMKLFEMGDPDFLLQELERAAEALESQLNDGRRQTVDSRGSVQQPTGYSINS